MTLAGDRRAALVFGVALPLLQLCRVMCWGSAPSGLEWPIAVDAYVSGARLLSGATVGPRRDRGGHPLRAGGGGSAGGTPSRSSSEPFPDRSGPGGDGGRRW